MASVNDQPTRLPAYDGRDMISFIMEHGGFSFVQNGRWGAVKSMTNVGDTAIVVMDYAVFRARPAWDIGFCIEMVSSL